MTVYAKRSVASIQRLGVKNMLPTTGLTLKTLLFERGKIFVSLRTADGSVRALPFCLTTKLKTKAPRCLLGTLLSDKMKMKNFANYASNRITEGQQCNHIERV